MPRLSPVLRRLLLAAPLAGAGAARVWAADPVPAPAPVAPSSAVLQPAPGVEVQYDLLAPANGSQPVPARLAGSLDTGEGRLRSSMRIDPASERRVGALDTSWELQAPGPLKTLVLGDTYASGAGWSQPARLTGLRFGRPVALRAPRSAADPARPAAPAFAASTQGLGEASQSALLDAKRWLPTPAAAAPLVPGGPKSLAAGDTDYEVELGRLRNGMDSADRSYQSDYAAAAWRAGLGRGLTAEARSEWAEARAARGLEVLQDVGAGAALQAVLAQSQAAGGQGSGLRWGMGVVRSADGASWSLAYDTAERGFTGVTGTAEARAGVRAAASLALGPRASADISYLRQLAWDASAPDTAMTLATHLGLARQVKLSLNVQVREGITPGWRAGMALSLPLDSRSPP